MTQPMMCPKCGYPVQPFMRQCIACGYSFGVVGIPNTLPPVTSNGRKPSPRGLLAVIGVLILLLCGIGIYSATRHSGPAPGATSPSTGQDLSSQSDTGSAGANPNLPVSVPPAFAPPASAPPRS